MCSRRVQKRHRWSSAKSQQSFYVHTQNNTRKIPPPKFSPQKQQRYNKRVCMFVYVSRGYVCACDKSEKFYAFFFMKDFWQYVFEIYLWKLKMGSLYCLDRAVSLILYLCRELSIGSLSCDGQLFDSDQKSLHKLQYLFLFLKSYDSNLNNPIKIYAPLLFSCP